MRWYLDGDLFMNVDRNIHGLYMRNGKLHMDGLLHRDYNLNLGIGVDVVHRG